MIEASLTNVLIHCKTFIVLQYGRMQGILRKRKRLLVLFSHMLHHLLLILCIINVQKDGTLGVAIREILLPTNTEREPLKQVLTLFSLFLMISPLVICCQSAYMTKHKMQMSAVMYKLVSFSCNVTHNLVFLCNVLTGCVHT